MRFLIYYENCSPWVHFLDGEKMFGSMRLEHPNFCAGKMGHTMVGVIRAVQRGSLVETQRIQFPAHWGGEICLDYQIPVGGDVHLEFRRYHSQSSWGWRDPSDTGKLLHQTTLTPRAFADLLYEAMLDLRKGRTDEWLIKDPITVRDMAEAVLIYEVEANRLGEPDRSLQFACA